MDLKIPQSAETQKTQQSKLKTQELLPKTAVQEKIHSIKLNIIDQNWGYPLKNHQERQIGLLSLDYCGEDFHQKSSP